MKDIIKNARMASRVWSHCGGADKIKRYFHLRPTTSGVTIVSTLKKYEMRGIEVASETGLRQALNDIAEKYAILISEDKKKRAKVMKKLGFDKRGRRHSGKGEDLEEVVQATMINTMSADRNLAHILNAQKVEFVASELIWENKPVKVDIVGVDKTAKTLYFFELKKDRTLGVEQVSQYVQNYNSSEVLKKLKDLLKNYPNHPVEQFDRIKGVMVMKYAGNTRFNKWREMKKEKGIEIIFYEPSWFYTLP